MDELRFLARRIEINLQLRLPFFALVAQNALRIFHPVPFQSAPQPQPGRLLLEVPLPAHREALPGFFFRHFAEHSNGLCCFTLPHKNTPKLYFEGHGTMAKADSYPELLFGILKIPEFLQSLSQVEISDPKIGVQFNCPLSSSIPDFN